jgi:hypothetical protein
MSCNENIDELVSITKDLAEVVSEICGQIKVLKEERLECSGEMKDAYSLVIKNKIWIVENLIGAYGVKHQDLELDIPDVVLPTVSGGPTGCSVEV